MLSECIRSVMAQTVRDIDQIFIVDREKKGLLWANTQFHLNHHRIDGKHVYMLDDDAVLIENKFVEKLKLLATENDPDVILFREYISVRGTARYDIVPSPEVWNVDWESGERAHCFGSGSCFVVKANLWKACTHRYFLGMGKRWHTGGDVHFARCLLKNRRLKVAKLDIIATRELQRGLGKRFERCNSDWWERIVKRFSVQEVAPNDWRLCHYLRPRQVSKRVVLKRRRAGKRKRRGN